MSANSRAVTKWDAKPTRAPATFDHNVSRAQVWRAGALFSLPVKRDGRGTGCRRRMDDGRVTARRASQLSARSASMLSVFASPAGVPAGKHAMRRAASCSMCACRA